MPSTADTNRPTDHPLMGHEDKPEGSFLQRLSADDWRFLLEDDLRGRSFGQDEHLPMAQDDRNVYMIWDGVVRQDRFPLGDWDGAPAVTRFRGGGQLVGEAKLISPESAVRTRCLTRTVVIPAARAASTCC